MDNPRRLSVLKHMLAQLTGTETEPSEVPATPQVAQLPDPVQRKLQLLRSMLSKLQGS